MTCSTGRDSANVVNPRRSMNITVAHRRTAPIDGRPPVAVRSSAAIGSGRKRVKTSFTRCCSRSCRRRRLSPESIRARRIAGSNGLGRKSSAPASMHRTMAAVSSIPEIMITGTWRSPVVVLEALEHLDPVQAGHLDVEQDQVGRFGLERRERVETVLELDRAVPVVLEMLGEQSAIQRIVIDDRDRGGGRSHAVQAAPRGVGPA